MGPIIDAWFVLVVAVAGFLNQEQNEILEYLLAENRVLKEQLKSRGGRIRFTDEQRRLLAAKAKQLGRAALKKLDTLVTPDTLRISSPSRSGNPLAWSATTCCLSWRSPPGACTSPASSTSPMEIGWSR